MGTNMREFSADREVGMRSFPSPSEPALKTHPYSLSKAEESLENTGPAFTIFSLGFYSSQPP